MSPQKDITYSFRMRVGMVLALALVACSGDAATSGAPRGRDSGTTTDPPSGANDGGRLLPDGGGGGDDDDASTASPGPGPGPGLGSGGTGGEIGKSVALPGCAQCRVHVPPSYATKKPAPLLVALHGDEGPAQGVPSVISLWSAAADAHGYLLLAMPCGAEIGCADGNWSGWLAAQSYQITTKNIAAMNAMATKMESLYDVDTKRELLAGYSGGAYALGYFAQSEAARYQAVAFVAGGMPAWTGTGHACPTRKIPGYFLGGDGDPRTAGQMSDTATSFSNCSQPFELDIVKNADHFATINAIGTGRGEAIAKWFDARPAL